MIETHDLVKWYGPTLAVDRLSFAIPPGQIVGFLGPNGAGKTTTLRIVTGYMPPTSGRAVVANCNVLTESRAARSRIGYMPEASPLYPEMRVDEYLHFRGKLHGMSRTDRVRRIDELCARCGLDQVRRRVIGHLSKGNRQRVGMAQALLHDPPVIILDEPTSGLDPLQIVQIRHLLEELRQGHTILISSHTLTEIERVADRIMVIRQGRLVADGTTDELCARARGGARIAVVAMANPGALKAELAGIDGVRQIETTSHDGWCQATVVPADGADVREPILAAVTAQGWRVREIRRREVNLEDYYLQLFRELDEQAQKKTA